MKDHCAVCGDDREDYFCPTCKRTFEMTVFENECYSPCCGELLDPDNRICPSCLENY